MAEIPGQFRELQKESFDPLKADSEISRVRMIELMNFIDRESYHLGDVVESFLTYDQFRSEMGETWTIMQGQNIQTSDLANELSINNLPDLVGNQGMLLQSKDETDLADAISGNNKDHIHDLTRGSNTISDYYYGTYTNNDEFTGTNSNSSEGVINGTDILPDAYGYTTFGGSSAIRPKESVDGNPESNACNTSSTGTVFKPKSYKMNYFIKVNNSRSWSDV